VQRERDTFIGIDLGGARGKTTAVAHLSRGDAVEPRAIVERVMHRCAGRPWTDDAVVALLAEIGPDAVVAINAPLTAPACLRCALPACPGVVQCEDPAVQWLEAASVALIEQVARARSEARDRDRLAVPMHASRPAVRAPGARRRQVRLEPYVHRATEVVMRYERRLMSRDGMGQGTGPIAARALHLCRRLAGLGFARDRNLLEVSPRLTVHALFGADRARGYKRDADPWQTRAAIVEELADLRFGARSRLAREEVLRNDHCFEALLSAYTAYLWARDGWERPDDPTFDVDGWIWAPP
jgi:hypothetical protein